MPQLYVLKKMKKRKLDLLSILILFFGVLLVGCEEKNEVPTFVIERQGEFYPDEYFEVVEVYGFSDNEAMARELTDYLRSTEPGGAANNQTRYRYRTSNPN